MSTLARYTLLQIPGWIGAAALLGVCWELGLVSERSALILFGLWFLKDVVTYPLVRKAYERLPAVRSEELIGLNGNVQRPLAPKGFIRVRGELWRAEVADGATALPAGTHVVVQAARGLTLIVAKDPAVDEEPTSGGRRVDAATDRRPGRRR